MRKHAFIVFLMLFLALNSFIVYAGPIRSISAIPSTTTYSPTTYSIFSITWSNGTANTTVDISSVKIIINGANYPMIKISGDELSGTYDYQEILGAGDYQWESCAMDNESSESCTVLYNFTIEKGSIDSFLNVYINGQSNDQTLILPSTANISASSSALGDSNVTYNLWENNTPISSGNNNWSSPTLTPGVYRFFYNSTEGANWSSGTTNSLYLYVTDLNFSGSNAAPSSGVVYSSSATYNFSINLIGNVSSVIFEANFLNNTLINYTNSSSNYNITNSGGSYWISFPTLSGGSYNYRWIANDNNGITLSSPSNYVITPFSVPPSLLYSGNGPSWTEAVSTPVTITCQSGYPVSLTIVDTNGNCLSSTAGNPVSCAFTTGSNDGGGNYLTCSVSSNSNYTGSKSGWIHWYQSSLSTTTTTTTTTTSTSGSFIITPSSSSLTVEPGSSNVVTLTLNNTLSSGYVLSINVSVAGIDSTWYSLDKTSITSIKSPGSDTVKLTLNIPSNAEAKTYTVIVTASGKDFTSNPILPQTTIKLNVSKEGSPTNLTEENNETANQTLGETSTNSTSQSGFLTGLSINPGDFRNTVLFIGLLIAGLIFIFRSNITNFIKGGKAKAPSIQTSQKKTPLLSSVKGKFSSLKERRLIIQLKKKRKGKA